MLPRVRPSHRRHVHPVRPKANPDRDRFLDQSRSRPKPLWNKRGGQTRSLRRICKLAEAIARIAPQLAIRQRVGRQQVLDTYHLTADGVTI